MDRRLSELPNRISTQDLTHRSRGDIQVKVHRPKFSGKKQLNCLRKVRPVNKGLSISHKKTEKENCTLELIQLNAYQIILKV